LISLQKRPLIPWLLILTALGLTAYLALSGTGRTERRNSAARLVRSAPDISLEGIRQTFIENGKKKWALKAASARLSRSSRQTEVNDIDATFFTADGKPIRVTADKGLISLDTSDAEISGNVIIHIQDYRISTQSLRYQAERHIINTDEQVRLENASLHLVGDGLRYDLLAKEAELTGNVNGIIDGNLTRQ
jgi:LPS export ABC transporter protein LptC